MNFENIEKSLDELLKKAESGKKPTKQDMKDVVSIIEAIAEDLTSDTCTDDAKQFNTKMQTALDKTLTYFVDTTKDFTSESFKRNVSDESLNTINKDRVMERMLARKSDAENALVAYIADVAMLERLGVKWQ